MMRRRTFLAGTTAALALPAIARGEATQVLKFVPQADLAVLDPVWTTTYQTRDHGFLVFDTLFGLDDAFKPQPQMAEGVATEDGGKTWRITLRPGLMFHDGTKVLARDGAASVRRWGARDAFGQALIAATDEISAPDDRTLVFRLKYAVPAAARRARQDAAQHVPDHAGAARQHRSVQAGDRDGRQRPVPLRRQRTRSRLARRLRALHGLCAARRAACRRAPPGRRSCISTASNGS